MNQLTKELERLEARDKDELIQELQEQVEELEATNNEFAERLGEFQDAMNLHIAEMTDTLDKFCEKENRK